MLLPLSGPPAFSSAALEKKLARVRLRNPGVSALAAQFVHLCDVSSELASDQRALLDRLLAYGPRRSAQAAGGTRMIVGPRLGTISPWSSKATEIARICGLPMLRRIERGISYGVSGEVA